MLELNLTCADDSQFDGQRVINKNLVYIGSDHSCDLFTPGDEIVSIHLFVEIVSGKLLLHLGDGVPFVHVDGKRTTSVRFIKAGQLIKFGNYELTISNFLETSYPTTRDSINSLTDKLLESGGPDLEILKAMQNYE